MKKLHPRNRLMFQLVFVMLLISLVPLLISDSSLLKVNEKYLENDLLGSHTQRARQLAESVSSHVQSTVEKLEIISRLQPLTRSFSDIQKYQLLFFFLEEYRDLISISMLDNKARLKAEVIRPEMNAVNTEKRDRVRKEVFEQSLQGDVYVSDPVSIPEAKSALVTIGLPIVDENRVVGVLLADLSMARIWEIVEGVTIRRSGGAYLVDRNGRLIAHKDRDRVMQHEDMKDVEIVGKYLALGNTGGALTFMDKKGEEMLGAYASLDLEGWGVVVQEPREDAYIIVAEMKRQILIWGVITGILVCVIGLFLARRISVPIMHFARSAMLIAQGNFKEKITVRSKNEIGQLAETFNHMVKQLDLYDKNMRRLFMSAIASLAAAIDERDPYTRGHSERVTEYSLAISDEMNLNSKEREVVHIAGLLHDIGKIGIDDSILRKPSGLNKAEYTIIKQHPGKGANIMSPIKQLKKIIPSMRHHHERFDGQGYPDGIQGDEIPLPARIIAVSDTFDAMTSDRPYQVAMEDEEVVELIKSWAGTRFDPVVIEAFVKAYQKNRIKGMKRKESDGQVYGKLTVRPHIA